MDCVAHKRFRFWSKREIDTPVRAEHVRHDRITTAFDAIKKKRRATFADHATMNLGKFEVGINLGFDGDDFVFSCKSIEECAQARMHLGFIRGLLDCPRTHACFSCLRFGQALLDLVVRVLGCFSDVLLVRFAKRFDEIE